MEGNPEAEQRLARAKLESLEGELLYAVARHVVDLEREIARMKRSGELPKDKGTYIIGEWPIEAGSKQSLVAAPRGCKM